MEPADWTKRRITFLSGGMNCAGWLLIPDKSGPFPCVILANGFSGTMDWILPDFGERFAAAGLAVLAFDYRHLGESDGDPRQIVDVRKQREDLRNAIRFAISDPAVDPSRVALWGTSLGGSHVIVLAAEDRRVAAVVANMPALDVLKGASVGAKVKKQAVSKFQLVATALRLLALATIDRVRGLIGMSPIYIRVYGEIGEAFFTDPALAERFQAVEKNSPTWKNQVAPRFLLQAPRYRKGTVARIAAPILFSLANRDVEVSADFIKEVAKESPRAEINEYPVGHFEMYHGEVFEQVAADQVRFLRQHLLVQE
jgi:dienelactone hydrolase